MSISANKGEWSEFYAFLKILSDKKIFSADENFVLIPGSFLNVLEIIRSEKKKSISYSLDQSKDAVSVCFENKFFEIPVVKITSKLSSILEGIRSGVNQRGSFTLPVAEDLMGLMKCTKVNADSRDKSDIKLRIEDPITATNQLRGFSIKSKLGGLATLLNASQATNIVYQIVKDSKSCDYSKAKINLKNKMEFNEKLLFSHFSNPVFHNNLLYIDSLMPEILAEYVKIYYIRGVSRISDITDIIYIDSGKEGPSNFYEYKIQELLISVALAMQPSKKWDGSIISNGGYIVVKEDGELACYHIYERDRFKSFLYNLTKFETPSASRHQFGEVYHEDGEKFIKLNLQIRFI